MSSWSAPATANWANDMYCTPHSCGVRITTGSWPRRFTLIVARDGYPVGGNVNFRHGLGATMLTVARHHLMKGSRV